VPDGLGGGGEVVCEEAATAFIERQVGRNVMVKILVEGPGLGGVVLLVCSREVVHKETTTAGAKIGRKVPR
jgi:hypothetical protein